MATPTPESQTPSAKARPRRGLSRRRKLIFSVFTVLTAYAVAETVATVLYLKGRIEPGPIWVHEAATAGPTVQFDPVRGFRLTRHSSRNLVMTTHGLIESQGTWQGNNQGFADRDDFSPQRPAGALRRFAVFGDSFTAAQFIKQNWPDAVEDEFQRNGEAVELLNFATDGAGLANWWSILFHHVEREKYEIDGIIFAVFHSDLSRPFFFADQTKTESAEGQMAAAYAETWDPSDWPRTAEEAKPFLIPMADFTVSSEFYEKAATGQWSPPVVRPFRLYLADRAWDGFGNLVESFKPEAAPDPADEWTLAKFAAVSPGRTRLINQIRRHLQERSLPAVVVHIPMMEELCGLEDNDISRKEARFFAEMIGAEFWDGAKAFESMSAEEIQSGWLIYDGHWGQGCSDRFAKFMAGKLKTWP